MSDEQTVYRLNGWLRLVRGDSVGIAVFTDGGNMQFLPETDNRLRISEFHPFFNEEGYTIERSLPRGAGARAYLVGSGVPIPFSKGDMTIIADSEGGSASFLEGQDRGDPTVKSVAEIIKKAETGAFEREGFARREFEFESKHSAVFLEAPVHSRYWIELFKRAALDAEPLPEHTRALIRPKLKRISDEWFKRFRTSGDPTLLGMFLQEVQSQGIVSRAYVRTTYYDVASHLLASGNDKALLAPALAMQIQRAIPEGLYYYDVYARTPKRTKRADRVTLDIDLLSHMRRILYDADHALDFRMALAAANLLFGQGVLHPEIHTQAKAIASHLVERIERGVESYTGRPPDYLVDQLVTLYRALVTLRQMMDWKNRSEPTVVALGLSGTAAFLMEQWLADRT
jgi:hypothetical protein